MVRLELDTTLAPGTKYSILCGDTAKSKAFELEVITADSAAAPSAPVTIDVLDTSLREQSCGVSFLRLMLQGIDEEFFSSGGILIATYDADRISIARRSEPHADRIAVYLDVPLPEDESIHVQAFDGRGMEIAAFDVDVADYGRNDESGCNAANSSTGIVGVALTCLLLLRRSRRGRTA